MFDFLKYLNRNKFFTLIELIAVIVVLSILTAIIIPIVSNMKNDSIKTMVESNTRVLQLNSDTYALKNFKEVPTFVKPTLENPQFIDFDKLNTDYLKKKPDLSKAKEQKYWVDAYGQVWGSTVAPPNGFFQSSQFIEWNADSETAGYNVYEVSRNPVSGKADLSSLKLRNSIENNGKVDKIKINKTDKSILISSIDKYGLESAPAGLNYQPVQDWFSPLVNKEGTFEFELINENIMYWDSFRTSEHKPEGTNINYRFSVKNKDGEYGPFVSDFTSLAASKGLKVQVTMKGFNSTYPSLYNMYIFYHYDYENENINKGTVIGSTNIQDNKPMNPYAPSTIEEEFTLPSDKQVEDIQVMDSYSPYNVPKISYSYKAPYMDNFIPIPSLSDVPKGSIIRIKREYSGLNDNSGSNFYTRQTIIKTSSHVIVNRPDAVDKELESPEWVNLYQVGFIVSSGDNQKTHWISADIKDTQPENTRIVYRYATKNSFTSRWSGEVDDFSKLPDSQMLLVRAYFQVKTEFANKTEDASIESIRIYHERGYSDLSLVKPTVTIVPEKSNNLNSEFFSPETKVAWKYEAVDPRNKQITNVEWAGDIREQYPIGTYEVRARVLNEANYWSDWTTYRFTVKEEKPVAVISNPPTLVANQTVQWTHSSYDPDGDGIANVEWGGDKRDSYPAGTYTVQLRVQDKEGYWSEWVSKTITIQSLFNGRTAIEVPALKNYAFGNQFTVEVKLNHRGGDYRGVINNGYYSAGSFELRFGRENYGERMGVRFATTNGVAGYNLYIPRNQDVTISIVYDGAQLKSYQNGILVQSAPLTGNIRQINRGVFIGNNGGGGEYFTNGDIREVRLWKKAKTESEINAQLNQELSGSEDSLFLYYLFNNIENGFVQDKTPYQHSGIIHN